MPEELKVVMEVGTFGDLAIDDPTAKKVKRKGQTENVDDLINEAIEANKQNLSR